MSSLTLTNQVRREGLKGLPRTCAFVGQDQTIINIHALAATPDYRASLAGAKWEMRT